MRIRLFRPWTKVCQNCRLSDNTKGMWLRMKCGNLDSRGYWHIYCIKKKKMYPWDNRKRCFIGSIYKVVKGSIRWKKNQEIYKKADPCYGCKHNKKKVKKICKKCDGWDLYEEKE